MILATFIPWFTDSYPYGNISGWEIFEHFGWTYSVGDLGIDDSGAGLWTGIFTLLAGIGAVSCGAWLAWRLDRSRETRPPYSRAVRIAGWFVGLVLEFLAVGALFSLLSASGSSLLPAAVFALANVLLLAGLITALKGEPNRHRRSAWLSLIAAGFAGGVFFLAVTNLTDPMKGSLPWVFAIGLSAIALSLAAATQCWRGRSAWLGAFAAAIYVVLLIRFHPGAGTLYFFAALFQLVALWVGRQRRSRIVDVPTHVGSQAP
jgi:hypothetical protein